MSRDGVFSNAMREVHPKGGRPHSASGTGSVAGASSRSVDATISCILCDLRNGVVVHADRVGLFVLRWKRPLCLFFRPYRCTGYPWPAAILHPAPGHGGRSTLWERPKRPWRGPSSCDRVPGYLYWKRASRKAACLRCSVLFATDVTRRFGRGTRNLNSPDLASCGSARLAPHRPGRIFWQASSARPRRSRRLPAQP